MRPTVLIETPVGGDLSLHAYYGDCLLVDAMARGEAPMLGYQIYPRLIHDTLTSDDKSVSESQLSWFRKADYLVVGMDLGVPTGAVQAAIDLANTYEIKVVPRWLGEGWQTRYSLDRYKGLC